jgi:hypothetical protein
MRAFAAVLGLIFSASAAWAQPLPEDLQPQVAPQAQDVQSQPAQPQSQSAWAAQFSGENWSLEETRLEPTLVRFNLKMNRFYSGGAGEARLIFERRAKALVRAGNFYSYQIVDYKESLNSFLFGGQRIAEGTIRLFPKI